MQPTGEWRDRAVCRHLDPSIWFNPETVELALTCCNWCVVTTDCLTDALMHNESGVRGGMTELERAAQTIPKQIGEVKVVVDYALFLDDI